MASTSSTPTTGHNCELNSSSCTRKQANSSSYLRGVAYQQNYSPNGSVSTKTEYTDPLADGNGCKRDIPSLKQIYTNVIRVYAVDPTANHDDCMQQLADADIYVIADLGEPNTSILSDDPSWDTTLYKRYTDVIDSLAKYKNVIGFFAGNENVSKDNQTGTAAFVKAAVRDCKGYIHSQGYRSTLGVGYATADVPSRNDLAHYFACEPGNTGNSTKIDFWGYNVYSWCGDSNYATSSYGERVDFFHDYPVPVFFAEYGCITGLSDPTHRPFTEVPVLYGNMTEVFSGGIVYEWFMGDNNYGLVSLSENSASVSPYPDFTSLQSQLASITPFSTARSAYKPTNTAPTCPSVSGTWLAQPSPLPPSVNPQLCSCMAANLQCNVKSTDATQYGDVFDYICHANSKFCDGIAHNATTGTYDSLSGCDPKDQLAWVANQYFVNHGRSASACDFSGIVTVQSASTSAGCQSLLQALGTGGTGAVASPTGKATPGVSSGTKKAVAESMYGAKVVGYGSVLAGGYVGLAVVSVLGMVVL
jgi:hypothetical protein